jgi:crossover junction endodeoxyribonuclease RuvC
MRILGVDCGTEKTGFGVIESDGRRHKLIAAGVIKTSPKQAFSLRLLDIAKGLRQAIAEHQPECAAVEEVFYAQNVKSALKLCHARGVALLAIAETGIEVGEYSPLEIKQSVVGYGRAEKQQVQLMVKSLLGLSQIIASEDASDACAVAICHATKQARQQTVARLSIRTSTVR